MWKIPLFDLNYGEEENVAVLEVLNSKWLSSGEKTEQFENDFSNYLGCKSKSVAVSNCTAALHMALMIAGVGFGDEVIISGLTFVADANVVTFLGAVPVFADVKSFDDWNVNVDDIKDKITVKTKAVIVVHYAGYPISDISDLVNYCKERNIILIEDVAHAVGASLYKKKCGTFGDFACFSFFSNKNLSTGEGGMLVTNSAVYEKEARLLRSHGMSSMTIDRHKGYAISYDVLQPGFNYRIDELRSALGIVQLKKLDKGNLKRKTLVEYYREKIHEANIDIHIPFEENDKQSKSSYHIFPLMLPKHCDRIDIIRKMKADGIQTSIHYPAFGDFSYYSKVCTYKLKISNEISNRVLTLPLFPDLTFEEIDYIINKLKVSL